MFILSMIIYKNAYQNNTLTCNKYVMNTYLYIALSLLIVSTTVMILDKYISFSQFFNNYSYLALFISTIIFLISTMTISPERTIIKHLSWGFFILLIGISLYPAYKLGKITNMLYPTLITTILLVGFLTLVAFYNPNLISLSMGPVLITSLFIGILLNMFIYLMGITQYHWYSNILSYIFIFIFCLLLLYDTKKLQINSKNCVVPDYINESIGIFLDIINLFSNILSVKTYK
tara:strand:+ start:68 stop:763 length:696 start_codon:yes stop_codon:yes gene_type:complete